MLKIDKAQIAMMLLAAGLIGYACGPASAAVRIEGHVEAGGSAVSRSTVTLWAATTGEPRALGSNPNRRRWPVRTACGGKPQEGCRPVPGR